MTRRSLYSTLGFLFGLTAYCVVVGHLSEPSSTSSWEVYSLLFVFVAGGIVIGMLVATYLDKQMVISREADERLAYRLILAFFTFVCLALIFVDIGCAAFRLEQLCSIPIGLGFSPGAF